MPIHRLYTGAEKNFFCTSSAVIKISRGLLP